MTEPRQVLVVGASRGLGRELATLFALDGWNVFATATRDIPLDADSTITWLACDLADENSWSAATAEFSAGIDHIVFCSAFDPRTVDLPLLEGLRRSLMVNGAGAYAFLLSLVESSGGTARVAVVNSEALYYPDRQSAAYAAGKAALKVFTAALSGLCLGRGGAVFELVLGPLDSDERRQRSAAAAAGSGRDVRDVVAQALVKANPESKIDRFIQPEDCLRLIQCGFDLGAIANGASFRLDGGSGGAFR
ncbi:SDR family NAD(P)-dependent oxidoreductase [Leifsonia sp. McL0607]|uniref:SDR family NAD(P)-dependent oxidoreductase n=1 Tax=Leifsonia sp. McL0607 TaxID=3415672 RepID=UPI003CEA0045